MLGGGADEIVSALSNAFADGGSLRVYRHAPNTGTRKSWAAGDATSRAVRLGLMVIKGEMGYPSSLSADTWGFEDVLFKAMPLYVINPTHLMSWRTCYSKSRFLPNFMRRQP